MTKSCGGFAGVYVSQSRKSVTKQANGFGGENHRQTGVCQTPG